MPPTDPDALVHWIGDAIGDPPLGKPLQSVEGEEVPFILFEGRDGLYKVVNTVEGLLVLHIDKTTQEITGVYNVEPSPSDEVAAELAAQIVSNLPPLEFQIG